MISPLALFLIIAFAFNAYSAETKAAGPQGSGGGKGVVCRDTSGNIKSAELLDLWEAEHIFNRKISASNKTLPTQVQDSFARLKYSLYMPYQIGGADGSQETANDYFVKAMQITADYFLKTNSNIDWMKGVSLTPTDDSYEQAKPEKCAIEQLVNYIDAPVSPRILVNLDIYNKLNATNQAALIAHEAFYAFLRSTSNEPDSLRVRRAVGYVFSGEKFPEFDPSKTDYAECKADSFNGVASYSDLIVMPTSNNTTAIIPVSIFSQLMIGIVTPPSSPHDQDLVSLLTSPDKTCLVSPSESGTGPEQTLAFAIESSSPVDFTLLKMLVMNCDGGSRVAYLGDPTTTTVFYSASTPPVNAQRLTCKLMKSTPSTK